MILGLNFPYLLFVQLMIRAPYQSYAALFNQPHQRPISWWCIQCIRGIRPWNIQTVFVLRWGCKCELITGWCRQAELVCSLLHAWWRIVWISPDPPGLPCLCVEFTRLLFKLCSFPYTCKAFLRIVLSALSCWDNQEIMAGTKDSVCLIIHYSCWNQFNSLIREMLLRYFSTSHVLMSIYFSNIYILKVIDQSLA